MVLPLGMEVLVRVRARAKAVMLELRSVEAEMVRGSVVMVLVLVQPQSEVQGVPRARQLQRDGMQAFLQVHGVGSGRWVKSCDRHEY